MADNLKKFAEVSLTRPTKTKPYHAGSLLTFFLFYELRP